MKVFIYTDLVQISKIYLKGKLELCNLTDIQILRKNEYAQILN